MAQASIYQLDAYGIATKDMGGHATWGILFMEVMCA
jgi:hypothetical protein